MKINLKKIKLNTYFTLLLFFSLLSFLIYSALYIGLGNYKFNSPDEMSNAFFAYNFYKSNTLKVKDEIYYRLKGILLPRSVKLVGEYIVPGGFLGLPILYGLLSKIINFSYSVYFTPFLASIGGIFYYLLINELFKDKKVSFYSALLLYTYPGYWYYASRGYLPNVSFLVFLLIAFYNFLQYKKNLLKRYLLFSFLSFFISLSIRPVELLWLGPLILFYIYYIDNKKNLTASILKIFIWLFLSILGYLLINYFVYDSFFYNGYITNIANQSISHKNFLKNLLSLLPFSFNIKLIIKNFYNYYLYLFWWYSIPIIMGSILFFKKYPQKRIYIYISLFVFLFLIGFYGSWEIYDNINKNAVTIGNSYVRYWLPSIIFFLPFFSLILIKTLNSYKIIILSLFFVLSFYIVWFSEEGLYFVRENMQKYYKISINIQKLTEKDALIFANRSDKIFFPERHVVEYNQNFKLLSKALTIMQQYKNPLYLYTMLPWRDINYIENKFLKDKKYKLKLVKEISSQRYLYKFIYE